MLFANLCLSRMEGRMQGKAQFSDSNRRIMEADAPPRRVYQAWKGSNVRDSCSLFHFLILQSSGVRKLRTQSMVYVGSVVTLSDGLVKYFNIASVNHFSVNSYSRSSEDMSFCY